MTNRKAASDWMLSYEHKRDNEKLKHSDREGLSECWNANWLARIKKIDKKVDRLCMQKLTHFSLLLQSKVTMQVAGMVVGHLSLGVNHVE